MELMTDSRVTEISGITPISCRLASAAHAMAPAVYAGACTSDDGWDCAPFYVVDWWAWQPLPEGWTFGPFFAFGPHGLEITPRIPLDGGRLTWRLTCKREGTFADDGNVEHELCTHTDVRELLRRAQVFAAHPDVLFRLCPLREQMPFIPLF